MPSKRKIVRSAKTGKFAPKRKAKTAPATHVTETVVLDVTHDPFAVPAIKAYIKACQKDQPMLAADLESLIRGLCRGRTSSRRAN